MPDWIVKVIVDRGANAYYRYKVKGENLNYAVGHPSRTFSWDVPSIDDPRYEVSSAVWDTPTGKLRDLKEGQRFRYAGYPDKFAVYVARGNGWYSSEAGYDGGPWHCPDDDVVTLP